MAFDDPMHWEIDAQPDDIRTGVADMDYKGVKNVPDSDWAKRVVDWALEDGLILPDNDNDWERNLTDGRYWTFEYRRR